MDSTEDVSKRKDRIPDQTLTEDRFREQLLKFSQFAVEQCSEGIFWIDEQGRFRYVNRAACHSLGYTRGELLQMGVTEIAPQFPAHLLADSWNELKKAGCMTFETMHRRKDGTQFPVEVVTNYMEFEGRPYNCAFARDITDRKGVEEKIRESSERYQMLFNNVHEAVIVHQPRSKSESGPYVEVNDMACQMYGYSREEFLKLTPLDLSLPENRPRILLRLRRLFEEKHILFETVHITKAGKNIPVEIHSHMIELKGKPTVLSIVRDITSRKEAERNLRENEELLNSIVESMTDGIMVMDKNYRISYWNRAMERISRMTHEKTLQDGKTAWTFFPGLVQKGIDQMIRRAMEGEVVRQDDIPYYMPDHTVVYTSETCTPLKGSGGEIRGVLNVVRDITEKKRLEARLQQAQKMEAIGTLAGGIAHDFNNILGIIIGNAELALDDVPEWNPAHYNLQEIKQACLRARDVVKQILAFSRHTDQRLEPISMTAVVRESLKFLRASLPSSIDIQHHLSARKDTIFSDATQINQILINLSTNAAHAMREKGGLLMIELENVVLNETEAAQLHELTPGEFVRLNVSDTGHGMEPQILERIFDPYFTTKAIGEGTGLGLAVVHGIVKNHKGAITVQSQLQQGSTFQIYLPLVDAQPLKKKEISEILPTGREAILFVDDEESITAMAEEMLKRLGYRVVCEKNPVEALKRFREQPEAFDLVITDMTMPQMLGTVLIGEIRRIRPELPVILCTGFSEQVNEEKALSLGISAFVMKPLVMRETAGIVRQVLDRT